MTAVIDFKYMPNASSSQKGTVLEIATADFNMADFQFNEYKPYKLFLK